jgi:hypothetical protein
MKKIFVGGLLFTTIVVFAQTPTTTTTTSFAKSLGIYVFPAKNQDKATQEKDDADCYRWAVEQSGIDPVNPPKVEAAQVDTSPDGTAVVGAAKVQPKELLRELLSVLSRVMRAKAQRSVQLQAAWLAVARKKLAMRRNNKKMNRLRHNNKPR